jgi:hypothetical protein
MDISSGDILAIAAVVVSIAIVIIGYCIRVELKFKKLEDELTIFNPIKKILIQKGEEQVVSVFNKERKP